ncbi:MAG: hypothetical protein WDN02_08590 [Methylovirgula sp.]|uniref:hypothetical protein n=1 Tax=Methylovirgula sp. TaxID=1978224 RepID=UPI00307680D5
MTRKLNFLFPAIVLMGIAAASVALAQSSPAPQSSHMQGMMSDQGSMQHMMKRMKPDQMKRMTEMMDKCHHMMDGAPAVGDGKRTSAGKC